MNHSSVRRAFCAGVFLLGLGATGAHAATYTVTSTSDSNGTCSSSSCSLREAVKAANANPGDDLVTFALPSGAQTIDLATAGDAVGQDLSALAITGNLTIQGPGAKLLTVRRSKAEATPRFRLFRVADGVNARFSGLTLSNGHCSQGTGGDWNGPYVVGYSGGAVLNAGNLTIDGCVLNNNAAFAERATPARVKSWGAGGAIYSTGTLMVQNSTFSGNRSYGGGGITSLGNLTLKNSTFSLNTAEWGGGGGLFSNATATVSNCTFYRNTAGAGSGVYNYANMDIRDCTLSNNIATNSTGGGLFNFDNLTVGNCIFNDIEGYSLVKGGFDSVIKDLGNNIVRDSGYRLTGGEAGVFTASTNQLNTDALLGPFKDNGGPTMTMALIKGSPAIDRGNSTQSTDQRGVKRPQGSAPDAGAFELVAAGTPNSNRAPIVTSLQLTPTAPRTGAQLMARVSASDPDRDALFYTYTWTHTRRGKSTVVRTFTTTRTLDTLDTKDGFAIGGDTVTVKVVAKDGTASSPSKSASVTISNTPVTLTKVTLSPTSPKTRDMVQASVEVQDADGTVPRLTYVWSKTSAGVTTTLATFTSTKTGASLDLARAGNGNKGDTITLTVTASDGESTATKSASVKIVNSVPVLTSLKLTPTDPQATGVVRATVTASDLDVSDRVDQFTYIYMWRIGSHVLGETQNNILDLSKYSFVKAGDSIWLQVRVSDGTVRSEPLFAQGTVASAPPSPAQNSAGSS